jgi:hypothetical protein
MLLLLSACLKSAPPSPPIATGLPPALVRIEQPYIEDAVLFADELQPLQAAVAAFLVTEGFTMVSLEEQQAMITAATRGERYPDGASCAVPYVADRLLEHHYPDVDTIDIRAECEEDSGCTLEVMRHGAPSSADHGITLARWVAPLADVPSFQTAVQAVEGLKATPLVTEYGNILGMGSGQHTARGVDVADVEVAGGWEIETAEGLISALDFDGCWTDFRRDSWANPIVASFNEQGAVTRCESRHPRRLPESENACGCDVLRAADFGAGGADRRAIVNLDSSQPALRSDAGQVLMGSVSRPTSETVGLEWADSGVGKYRLAECFSGLPEVQATNVPVRYQVDAAGVPITWEASWPAGVGEEQQACMAPLLDEARFGCPLEPSESVVELNFELYVSGS